MSESDLLRLDVADFVATATKDTPPVKTQNRQFRQHLIRMFDTLNECEDVRAVILTGAGEMVSACGDLKGRPLVNGEVGSYTGHNRLVRDAFNSVHESEKPVMATINSPANDAGLLLRHSDCCRCGVGFHAGDRGRICRQRTPHTQAFQPVRCVLSSDDGTQNVGRPIARRGRAAKKPFLVAKETLFHGGYRFEQTQTAALRKTEERAEAAAAFKEKRKPMFKGR